MKKILYALFFVSTLAFSQQPYYSDVNLTLTGQALYNELQMKIAQHNLSFTYGDARDVLVFTDENPDNTNNVLLVYGYNDNDGNCTTDRSRDKNDFGGLSCEYNREHVFARSLTNPSMGNANNAATGIIADPHNIRACDQQMNNNKGDKLFQNGSGNAGNVGSGNWYPGDEWKGDVARMIMYMYTRYGDQCLPSLAGVGNLQSGTQMLETFLQWNADDPVTEYEDQRNDYLQTVYGNRNPFIDNPALATIIWGGPLAEDRWGLLSTQTVTAYDFVMYPNPSNGKAVTITSNATMDTVIIYNLRGQVIMEIQPQYPNNVKIQNLESGFYLVQLKSEQGATTKKLIIK
jgi:hypothetical protein